MSITGGFSLKVLDRYLTRELFFPIFIISLTLVFLFLVADLFDNLDLLLNNKVPVSIMLEYYVNLIPYSYIQIACWASWIGTVYLLIQLGLHNEMTAMKAAGLSMQTIVKPILFLGFLIGVLVFVVNEWVVPPSYSNAKHVLDVYIEKNQTVKQSRIYKNLTYNVGGKLLIYLRKFNSQKNVAVDVVILKWDSSERNTYQKISAKKAHFNGTLWDLYGVTAYQTDSQGKVIGKPESNAKITYPEIKVRPEELLQEAKLPESMSIFELHDLISKMNSKGITATEEKVRFYERLALPWQSFLMMLFTLPVLGSVRSRKALAGMVLQCLAIIFTYHVMGAIFNALGKSGKIWPLMGAWTHHAIFFSLMFLRLERAEHE